MKIVISPAKSLDFETQVPTTSYTEYGFQKQSLAIDKVLKKIISPTAIAFSIQVNGKAV